MASYTSAKNLQRKAYAAKAAYIKGEERAFLFVELIFAAFVTAKRSKDKRCELLANKLFVEALHACQSILTSSGPTHQEKSEAGRMKAQLVWGVE